MVFKLAKWNWHCISCPTISWGEEAFLQPASKRTLGTTRHTLDNITTSSANVNCRGLFTCNACTDSKLRHNVKSKANEKVWWHRYHFNCLTFQMLPASAEYDYTAQLTAQYVDTQWTSSSQTWAVTILDSSGGLCSVRGNIRGSCPTHTAISQENTSSFCSTGFPLQLPAFTAHTSVHSEAVRLPLQSQQWPCIGPFTTESFQPWDYSIITD